MLATPAAVGLAAMLAVRAMWLVITPLVTLAVSAVLAGGWLVFTLAALAALTPPMPPPLGGPDTRPDTRLGTHRVRRVLRLRGAPVPPPLLTAAAAAAAAAVAAAAAAAAVAAAAAALAAVAALAVVATAAAVGTSVGRPTPPRRSRPPPLRCMPPRPSLPSLLPRRRLAPVVMVVPMPPLCAAIAIAIAIAAAAAAAAAARAATTPVVATPPVGRRILRGRGVRLVRHCSSSGGSVPTARLDRVGGNGVKGVLLCHGRGGWRGGGGRARRLEPCARLGFREARRVRGSDGGLPHRPL